MNNVLIDLLFQQKLRTIHMSYYVQNRVNFQGQKNVGAPFKVVPELKRGLFAHLLFTLTQSLLKKLFALGSYYSLVPIRAVILNG